ncbi:RIP metalloprotease RseP [Thiorhodospira sibirica]|uniref:RIP metalloprotease RseP n=1 Tax=Thiorhodospira sibirica TaxID=154347 RepID=UPI00022C33D4|nr:RIP metalloprotease RseP [Thiorhodospira sibirica]
MTIAISIAAFLLVIGILVTVHEFGHYLVARLAGVKVVRFSVGFGRPLLCFRAGKDRTEYVLGAVPLGGYVRMLDEREDEVAVHERHRAFNRQPVGRRMAIVAAGPAANFLFAIVAYAAMFMVGVNGLKPIVGEIAPGSLAAQAGLQTGERIIAVEHRPVHTWEMTAIALLEQGMDGGQVAVQVVDAQGREYTRWLDLSDTRQLLDEGPLLDKLGIGIWRPVPPAVLGELLDDGAAQRAGLKPGDRIVRANGQSIAHWHDWVAVVQAHPQRWLSVEFEREGSRHFVRILPDARDQDGQTVGQIGAYPAVDQSAYDELWTTVRHGPWTALLAGMVKTWDMTVLSLRMMWRLVTGEASVKNIAGPIGIAEHAGMSAVIGLAAFLSFLAIVSISLGIINLLPIPVLDGGHLVNYCIEIIKGSPVSPQAEAIAQHLGLVMIALLMTLAFYNDIMRFLG